MRKTARWVFLAAMFSVPMPAMRVGPLSVSDWLFAVSLLCLLPLVMTGATPARRFRHVGVVAGLFVVGGLLCLLRTENSLGHVDVLVRLIYVVCIWQWQAKHLFRSQEDIYKLLLMFLMGAATSGVVGLLQISAGLQIGGEGLIQGRAQGLGPHPNEQGATLGVALVMGVVLLSRWPHKRKLVAVAVGMCAVGILVSSSVTAVISTVVGLVVAAFWMRTRLTRLILVVTALFLVLQVTVSYQDRNGGISFVDRFESATNGYGVNTAEIRSERNRAAWEAIQTNPIVGVGLDSESGLAGFYNATHNIVLLAWFQGGLLVLVGVFVAAAIPFRYLLRRRSDDVCQILFVGAVVALVFAQTAPVLLDRFFWAPFMLAMLHCAINARKSEQSLASAEFVPLPQGSQSVEAQSPHRLNASAHSHK